MTTSTKHVFVAREGGNATGRGGGGVRQGSGKEEMGATTTNSSSSSTTARPCCAGCALLELISVCTSGRDVRRRPYGTVRVYDGRRGQVVYSLRRDHQAAPSRRSSRRARNQGWIVLPLTGPHRAISAEGRVSMALDLHDAATVLPPRQEATVVLWDAYSPDLLYDMPIKRAVDTLYGSAEVTYVVRSNAVQGAVQVRILMARRRDSWDPRPGAVVKGKITARGTTSLAEAAAVAVLFDGEDACTSGADETAIVPLSRSIVAAPVKHPLIIEVDLRTQSGEAIVQGSLKFFPKLDEEQHVERLVGTDGVDAEVTVSWSD